MDGFIRDVVTLECRSRDAVGHGVKELLLCPDGVVKSKNGTFVMDDAAAGSIIGEFKSHGVDVVVDIDHATLQTDKPAPAAGWIKDLFYQPGRGLLALVLWNDRAREMIRAGEYAYISPVLMVRKSDRRAVSLHSAAVTNKPAIPAMERVAASARAEEDDPGEIPTPEDWIQKI
ncbi:MAG: phage protease, partial [Planctomycetes bacterium]|nr:phage protease [Planctomycetota bacterium]